MSLAPSMEPRLRSRGSDGDTATCTVKRNLQWSRGCEAAEASLGGAARRRPRSFNGAAAAKPRKLVGDASDNITGALQWSRGCEAAEADNQVRVLGYVGHLQWSRGCEAAEARPTGPGDRCALPPSMEPRLRSRGSASPEPATVPARTLQWSRGCEAAEATWHRTSGSWMRCLQWSRGCEAAEARRNGVACRRGACLQWSRGSTPKAVRAVYDINLQWSRGCEAAEARQPARWRTASSAFNGAAAAKPRKLGKTPVFIRWAVSLQWSRGCEAAEASGCARLLASPLTFNGAAAAKPRKRRQS